MKNDFLLKTNGGNDNGALTPKEEAHVNMGFCLTDFVGKIKCFDNGLMDSKQYVIINAT